MDLIYAKPDRSEVGVVESFEMDMAFGYDENDFELTVPLSKNVMSAGYIVYVDKTEYGGVVDSVRLDTEKNTVCYKGRTWHGILENRIIEPASGKDYRTVSGDANKVLWDIVSALGLGDTFERDTSECGIYIESYRFERYCRAYTAIRKMLSEHSAKLVLKIDRIEGKVIISAAQAVDWSYNEPISSDKSDFEIETKKRPVNHLICAGEGELKDREVIHLYADGNGRVSRSKTFTGIDEVVEFYDYKNAKSDELLKSGTERLSGYQVADEVKLTISPEYEYDIGDIITATDARTGQSATTVISKKIVSIDSDSIDVTYDVGGYTESQIDQARKAANDASAAIRRADAAAAAAAIASTSADGKVRVFTSQPVPPYKKGDLWVNGDGMILICTESKEE